jgi:hypothetical protein
MYLKDLLTQWDQFEIPPDIQKQCHRATEGIRDLYKKFIETSVTVGIIPKDRTTEASIYAMGLTMHLGTFHQRKNSWIWKSLIDTWKCKSRTLSWPIPLPAARNAARSWLWLK